ncbi:protoporphyrin IX magnesium-chelatase [Desulfocicer vacuolatum DSM 3385]|uniref:Mg-protoporphyrin IX chelatase n=1 Tax=Desulfocicer vacuolatum DSM 3385 TaxID=1121400 RepID=A0A1W1YSU6_9BACT|nr:putative cobaltochelatase [Desulfocicer vacuolatum]SMC38788.1 protoporphyrin IX magnesium-chelatase [Desulfocicer vacuolatum DSM 3385]
MIFNDVFPFSAIVGQEDLKLALMLNAVHPGVGGVLIRGEKGTAKSTIVRGLADLLYPIEVVSDCPFSCDPGGEVLCDDCQQKRQKFQTHLRSQRVVTLPLNATEDRVAGGMDFNRAVKEGKKVLLPGLLAQAHRGILYVDEINLLDDHIVDIILDAASSGENRIEREGLSFYHPARFIMVGTMNPEEGDLRPQLLDRLGLCVEVESEKDPEVRMTLMEQREAYDNDPAAFRKAHEVQRLELARKIIEARDILPRVGVKQELRGFIAELCATNNVAGHRADIVMEQAARAHAALEGRIRVEVEDISRVAPFVLLHRKRDAAPPPPPPEPPEADNDSRENEQSREEEKQEQETAPPPPRDDETSSPRDDSSREDALSPPSLPESSRDKDREESPSDKDTGGDQIFEIGATFQVKKISSPKDRQMRRGSGKRSRSRVSQKQGRYVKSSMKRHNNDVALDATLRAAAPFQATRTIPPGMTIALKSQDIREKIREKRMGNFLVFSVDASGSMGSRGRMAASKGAILSLLLDAYQKRDRVAMLSFRKNEAVVNLPPTASIELAAHYLKEMPVGGRTPLSAGLDQTHRLVSAALLKDPAIRPIVLIITDGKSNVAMGWEKPVEEALKFASIMGDDDRVQYIVVDTEPQGIVTFGIARKLALAARAEYCKIDDLKAESLVDLVHGATGEKSVGY